jgi:hypothetical protein
MAFLIDLTEAQIFAAIGNVLTEILPSTVEVTRLQVNRVPEPKSDDWVGMLPVTRERIGTNVDSVEDLAFTASIVGVRMTVTDVIVGTIADGSILAGPYVTTNTTVLTQQSGTPGGVGVYTVDTTQTAVSGLVWAGFTDMKQALKMRVQLDVHGPNSPENATIISTVFRDEQGVSLFEAQPYEVTPLYCDDPRQLPFDNDQQQVEERWTVDAYLQASPTVKVPQQFADSVVLTVINVDEAYPPS